jgi:DNA repair photolyase
MVWLSYVDRSQGGLPVRALILTLFLYLTKIEIIYSTELGEIESGALLNLIRDFDPWGDEFCTCPKKYSLSPYTGCDHGCLYCYITSYIPRAFECRPKEDLIERVKRDLRHIDKNRAISISNSSDPYPTIEARMRRTRSCLELFAQEECRVLIVTKSDLVARDADLLAKMPAVVSVTITTLDENLSRRLEPNAPAPRRRLNAIEKLVARGVPVAVRLDPIIPGLDDAKIERTVKAASAAGAKHVTSSTFKPRPDSWRRVQRVFPEVAAKLAPLYLEQGERHHNSRYLPGELRLELMRNVKEACDENGLTFASCREGFQRMATSPSCDGSHLISRNNNKI